jgi:hypothetical protein
MGKVKKKERPVFTQAICQTDRVEYWKAELLRLGWDKVSLVKIKDNLWRVMGCKV